MKRAKIRLGDVMEKIITGVTPQAILDKAEEKEGCGCGKRKEILNRVKV